MIFAVFDPSPFSKIYICCFITSLSRLLITSINTTFVAFSSWRPSTAGEVRMSNMRHHARCCANRSNRCRDIGRRHLGFCKFQICNRPNGHEGRTASSCQISLKSLKLMAIFRFFKMAAAAMFDF